MQTVELKTGKLLFPDDFEAVLQTKTDDSDYAAVIAEKNGRKVREVSLKNGYGEDGYVFCHDGGRITRRAVACLVEACCKRGTFRNKKQQNHSCTPAYT